MTGNCIKYARKGIYNFENYNIAKSEKYVTFCLQASNWAPKMGRRHLTWQLARSFSSVAR